jgi:hypothetical protein
MSKSWLKQVWFRARAFFGRHDDASTASKPRSAAAESFPCACFEGDFRKRPLLHERRLPGYDEQHSRFADTKVDTCSVCGRAWVHYHFEFEHLRASGRWYRGHVPPEVAAAVTAETAASVLESLPWYWCGGSYFDGKVHRTAGEIH